MVLRQRIQANHSEKGIAMTKAQQKLGIGRRIGAVTRAGLQALRDQLARPSSTPELTPGGPSEELVHAEIDAAKRAALARGEQSLRDASQRIRKAHAFAANKGRAKADFIHREAKAARARPPHGKSVNREPSR